MGNSDEIWYTVYWINLLQNDINLTWMMSLHYLVKLEILIGMYYHWVLTEGDSRFIPPQLWSSYLPDLNPFDNTCGKYCKRRSTKRASLIWTYRQHHWHGCCSDDMIQLGPLHSRSLFQFVQISDACFVHLFFLDWLRMP